MKVFLVMYIIERA